MSVRWFCLFVSLCKTQLPRVLECFVVFLMLILICRAVWLSLDVLHSLFVHRDFLIALLHFVVIFMLPVCFFLYYYLDSSHSLSPQWYDCS